MNAKGPNVQYSTVLLQVVLIGEESRRGPNNVGISAQSVSLLQLLHFNISSWPLPLSICHKLLSTDTLVINRHLFCLCNCFISISFWAICSFLCFGYKVTKSVVRTSGGLLMHCVLRSLY